MSAPKPIQIIGGGLAGLTLGIALRRLDIPVTILEAGHYPRHRVCGEFISGRGQATLARLGLRQLVDAAGAVNAQTVAFHSATKSSPPQRLPVSAICVSRFALDAALAKLFRELGGELCEGRRTPTENIGEGCIRATGRSARTEASGARWFGLKIHARNVALTADLEMHFSPRGYVGLCKINGDEVNICGLFRKGASEIGEAKHGREFLRGPAGSPLYQRLANAVFDEDSLCAVAGLSLEPRQALTRTELCLGDAITMIPPVTGNGMSMAFESAELAVAPLAAWSRGKAAWSEVHQKIARDCDTLFACRLAWAKWLQQLALTPRLQNPLLAIAARSNWFCRTAFELTR